MLETNIEDINEFLIADIHCRDVSMDTNIDGESGMISSDYNALENKPSINGHELIGDLTSKELDISSSLQAGDNVEIVNNKINVLTSSQVEEDNTKPITSAAVYTEVGNINILLQTI